MDLDLRLLLPLVLIGAGAVVLGLSYVGVYLLGQARGRRDAERERRLDVQDETRVGYADRLMLVEGAIDSMARTVERVTDVQRLMMLERAKPIAAPEPQLGTARGTPRNTPA
jgi:hypothetical protein